jgi:hypothetical protein
LVLVVEVAVTEAPVLAVMLMVVLEAVALHQLHLGRLPMVEALVEALLTLTRVVLVALAAHQAEIMVVTEQEQTVGHVVQILPTPEVLAAAHHITAVVVLLALVVVL